MIVVPVSAADTGQPVLAASANVLNWSAVRPGTLARTVKTMPVMPWPATKVTSALVSTAVGGVPLPASA